MVCIFTLQKGQGSSGRAGLAGLVMPRLYHRSVPDRLPADARLALLDAVVLVEGLAGGADEHQATVGGDVQVVDALRAVGVVGEALERAAAHAEVAEDRARPDREAPAVEGPGPDLDLESLGPAGPGLGEGQLGELVGPVGLEGVAVARARLVEVAGDRAGRRGEVGDLQDRGGADEPAAQDPLLRERGPVGVDVVAARALLAAVQRLEVVAVGHVDAAHAVVVPGLLARAAAVGAGR